MFLVTCTNKGCYQYQQPYIDPITRKVYCSKCDQEIINITEFSKNQMISLKQFKVKEKTSFMIKCSSCEKEGKPIINNDKILCKHCKKELANLSITFINVLKNHLT